MIKDVTNEVNFTVTGGEVKSVEYNDETCTYIVTGVVKGRTIHLYPKDGGGKRCYISGKISGLTTSEYTANFQYAANAAEKMGYTAVNPVAVNGQKKWCWLRFMVADIRLLLPCEAIYLQRNWKDSKGSKVERFFAKCLRKTIIYQ